MDILSNLQNMSMQIVNEAKKAKLESDNKKFDFRIFANMTECEKFLTEEKQTIKGHFQFFHCEGKIVLAFFKA